MFTALSMYLFAQVNSTTSTSNNISVPPYLALLIPILAALVGAFIGPYFTHNLTKTREKDKSIDDQLIIGEKSAMELTILKAITDSSDKLSQQITGVRDELKGEMQGVEKRLEDKIYGVEKRLTAEIAKNATSIAVLSNTIDERIPKVPYSSRA